MGCSCKQEFGFEAARCDDCAAANKGSYEQDFHAKSKAAPHTAPVRGSGHEVPAAVACRAPFRRTTPEGS